MTGTQLIGAGAAATSVAVWVAGYLLALMVTRPDRPVPAPPTPDLGPEPPAVASLLTGGRVLADEAGEATLLDLAARRYLELRQPGNDPVQTTVHVPDPRPAGLNRYEQMIFDRVCSLAIDGVVPLTALAFRDRKQAGGFRKRVEAAVVADCRMRGLSQRRFGRTVRIVLNVMAVLCAIGLPVGVTMLKDTRNGHPVVRAAMTWWFGALILASIGNWPVGERNTPAGLEACARWLGVRA
jgi:hypothetical protein